MYSTNRLCDISVSGAFADPAQIHQCSKISESFKSRTLYNYFYTTQEVLPLYHAKIYMQDNLLVAEAEFLSSRLSLSSCNIMQAM